MHRHPADVWPFGYTRRPAIRHRGTPCSATRPFQAAPGAPLPPVDGDCSGRALGRRRGLPGQTRTLRGCRAHVGQITGADRWAIHRHRRDTDIRPGEGAGGTARLLRKPYRTRGTAGPD